MRIILHGDLDNFEFQVWAKEKCPRLLTINAPVVVVNHDNIILAMNPYAKNMGITRKKDGDEGENALKRAKRICEEEGKMLQILKAGVRYGRHDSFIPRVQSDKILATIQEFIKIHCPGAILERPNRDEFILDVTREVKRMMKRARRSVNSREKSVFSSYEEGDKLTSTRKVAFDKSNRNKHVLVLEAEWRKFYGEDLHSRIRNPDRNSYAQEETPLFFGSIIANKLRQWVFNSSVRFVMSVGIAPNKLLAKIACGLNKPEACTILSLSGFQHLCRSSLALKNIPGFGGTTGENIHTAFQLWHQIADVAICHIMEASKSKLINVCRKYAKRPGQTARMVAEELIRKCRGIDESPVVPRVHSKFVTCSYKFKDYDWDDMKTLSDHLHMEYRTILLYERIHEVDVRITLLLVDDSHRYTTVRISKDILLRNPAFMKTCILNFVLHSKVPLGEIIRIKLSCRRP